jgi:hypothetical protein
MRRGQWPFHVNFFETLFRIIEASHGGNRLAPPPADRAEKRLSARFIVSERNFPVTLGTGRFCLTWSA